MDAAGVEFMILSLNAPAVQAIWDVERAIAVAREANDVLAADIAGRPDRQDTCIERLMRSFEIELLHEGVEALLLLQRVRAGWTGG